jgi:hypothetical protein
MKNEIEIIKNLLLPLLGEEKSVLTKNSSWNLISSGFILFENDPKPLYTEIYKLEISDPENVISKLPELYDSFIDEIAEEYVLGKVNPAATKLIEQDSSLFIDRVAFLNTLKSGITKQERLKIRKELPNLANRMEFSFSEANIKTVFKKKAREDLKNKFTNWDNELKEKPNKKGKVISLSWFKYMVAASIIITAGLFYFKSSNLNDNALNLLADIETSRQTILIVSDNGLGYVTNKENKQIDVVFRNYNKRIVSINKIITENVVDDVSTFKIKLDSLNSLKDTYVFNKNVLTLNSINKNQSIGIVRLNEDAFYLNISDFFYKIIEYKIPTKLITENDETIINQLEKIIFQNE